MRDAFDLVAKRAPGTISRFGGHAFAAGLTLKEAALPRFAAEFEQVGREWLPPAALKQTVETDGALMPHELTFGLAKELATQVWGQGFAAPLFDGEFEVTDQRVVGDKHRRVVLGSGAKQWEGIVFNNAGSLPGKIRAVYRPEVNHYGGLAGLQVVIEQWEEAR